MENYGPATTLITYTYKKPDGGTNSIQGTGFIISKDGYLLTAAHVLRPVESGEVTQETIAVRLGSAYADQVLGTIISKDSELDVALLKLPSRVDGWPTVPVDSNESPKLGEPLFALGFPSGADLTVSNGAISALNAVISGSLKPWMQTSVPLTVGESGAPVFGAKGGVIGLVRGTAASPGAPISFVIPIKYANAMLATADTHSTSSPLCIMDDETATKPTPTSSIVPRPSAINSSIMSQLTGKWVNEETGEQVLVEPDGTVFLSQAGAGMISSSGAHGSNIQIEAQDYECYYYVTFINAGKVVMKLNAGARSCLHGLFDRVE